MRQLLSYMKRTLDLKLMLKAEDPSVSKGYADAAFAAHKIIKAIRVAAIQWEKVPFSRCQLSKNSTQKI